MTTTWQALIGHDPGESVPRVQRVWRVCLRCRARFFTLWGEETECVCWECQR